MTTGQDTAVTREAVRDRYAAAALRVLDKQPNAGCCGSSGEGCCGSSADHGGCGSSAHDGGCGSSAPEAEGSLGELYSASERAGLPSAAVEASLGCGNPLMVADLHEGETVLDLGSGGGIDVLLSAQRVGPTGTAYGLDMTDEMLELARRNAAEAGATNVEFLRGQIEDIPLPADSVDVVISNCVINLSTDKPAVFAATYRVLKPGGRIGVSDVVADNHLTPQQRGERGAWVGCIAGALTVAEYEQGLTGAGFVDVEITPTHEVADGMHSAIVRARKPRS
jgi:SAM-dependent methyltransferase